MHPSAFVGSSSQTRQARPQLLLALAALAWIGTASAAVKFTTPENLNFKPGDFVVANWTIFKPAPPYQDNLNPFTLVIRSATGQKYDLQANVQQSALTMRVRIPTTVTSGPHSFYAYYVGGNDKSSGSTQFIVSGPDSTDAPTAASDSGISSMTLIGIIAGAVVILLATAMLFICRNRRRVADAKHENRSMDDIKEAGFTSGPGSYESKNQDMESLTKSAGSGGGPVDEGMVAVSLNNGPGPRPPRPDSRPSSLTKNPFDSPESVLPSAGMSPRQQQQQPHQYQPPQLPPYGSPMAPPNAHSQQRSQGPYPSTKRDSFESEIESVYDPNRPRLANNGISPAMRSSPVNGPSLSKSASGRSTTSTRYPRNMTPQPQSPGQNPFENESQSPVSARAAPSPRLKEIDMQPFDVQQHHLEQQQKVLQRQQQQQQQAAPLASAAQLDDKTEVVEEEDKMPAYNGYRDTIFGAYAQAPGDDDEDDDASIPAVPAFTAAAQALSANSQPDADRTSTGGATIQRKKSVKFTGIPPSGPVVLPNNEAAKEHQAQRQQRHQQSQDQKQRPISEAEFTEGDDDDDDDDDAFEEVNPAPGSSSYQINTSLGSSTGSMFSPVRSPIQGSPFSGGYPAPPPPPPLQSSSDLDADSVFGQGFYEDVLAAVEKSVPSPSLSSVSPTTSATSAPTSKLPPPPPATMPPPPPAGAPPTYIKPVMPLIPRSPSPPPPVEQPMPVPQQFVLQHIPAPQAQHFQPVPVTEQVYGAPSPRVTPAVASTKGLSTNKNFPSPPMAPASVQPSSNNNNGAQNSGAFYEEDDLL